MPGHWNSGLSAWRLLPPLPPRWTVSRRRRRIPGAGRAAGTRRPLFGARGERLLLLFALFPTLAPLGAPSPPPRRPGRFVPSAPGRGGRGTNLCPALPVQSGFRAPRPSLGPRGRPGGPGCGRAAGGGGRRGLRVVRARVCAGGVERAAGGPGWAGGCKVGTGWGGALDAGRASAARRRGSLSAPLPAPRAGSASRGEPAGRGRGGRRPAAAGGAGCSGLAELLPGLRDGEAPQTGPRPVGGLSEPGRGAVRAPPSLPVGSGEVVTWAGRAERRAG